MLCAGRRDEAIARVNEGIATMTKGGIPTDWAYLVLAQNGSVAEARRGLNASTFRLQMRWHPSWISKNLPWAANDDSNIRRSDENDLFCHAT